jgi:hypothetical protein
MSSWSPPEQTKNELDKRPFYSKFLDVDSAGIVRIGVSEL